MDQGIAEDIVKEGEGILEATKASIDSFQAMLGKGSVSVDDVPTGLTAIRGQLEKALLFYKEHYEKVLVAGGPIHRVKPAEAKVKKREKWSAEEHRLYEVGLQLYGKNYNDIAQMMPFKSAEQVRFHHSKTVLKTELASTQSQESIAVPSGDQQRLPKRG